MDQRNNNDRNRNRDRNLNSSSRRRESSFHPYWNTITYYLNNVLRTSTSTSSTSQISSFPSPPPPPPPLIFPLQPPPQNPYYFPNPINPPYVVYDNSIFPLNFNIESINNFANFFRNTLLDYYLSGDDNVESRSSNSSSSSNSSNSSRSSPCQTVTYQSSSTSSSGSHVTSVYDDESYNGIKGKGCNFSYNTCTELSPRISSSTLNFNLNSSSLINLNLNSSSSLNFRPNFNLNSFHISSPLNFTSSSSYNSCNFNLNSSSSYNFNLNSFPYALSSLERYEIQIRIEGKITPKKKVSPHQLSKFLILCKKDHKTKTNSQEGRWFFYLR
ncbi:hypothetical protein RCL_jg432.t1 [Rhizophagus clarus]|uniref:Uncharacterized protein n=1 Tax=Rhizophagus clarus TaxID=94130 RepID=A0A8H3R0P0_9GLOM|nr:hypothetical protein RCL_jg432.t1 [Rhizophagus clarus]